MYKILMLNLTLLIKIFGWLYHELFNKNDIENKRMLIQIKRLIVQLCMRYRKISKIYKSHRLMIRSQIDSTIK